MESHYKMLTNFWWIFKIILLKNKFWRYGRRTQKT